MLNIRSDNIKRAFRYLSSYLDILLKGWGYGINKEKYWMISLNAQNPPLAIVIQMRTASITLLFLPSIQINKS